MSVTRSCPVCGYTASYASAARAEAHYRRHSCARRREAVERSSRRIQRELGRVSRECTHPRARHVHGTRAAYVKDRCRCAVCTAANTAASRAAHRAQIYGRWQPFLEATEVREHLGVLRAAGIGVEQIAKLTGISTSHVRALADQGRNGHPAVRRVRPDTAQRVLAVGVEQVNRAPSSHLEATGTRRRLQALVAIGWSLPQLAGHLGRSTPSLRRSMTGSSVTAQTAADVKVLYQRLENAGPPRHTEQQRAAADAARDHAAERGWLPPLAWDDIDTDPGPSAPDRPAAVDDDLDEIAIERAVAGDGIRLQHLTPAEQEEAIRRLTSRGKSIRDIAQQLATTKRTVSRRRRATGAA